MRDALLPVCFLSLLVSPSNGFHPPHQVLLVAATGSSLQFLRACTTNLRAAPQRHQHQLGAPIVKGLLSVPQEPSSKFLDFNNSNLSPLFSQP